MNQLLTLIAHREIYKNLKQIVIPWRKLTQFTLNTCPLIIVFTHRIYTCACLGATLNDCYIWLTWRRNRFGSRWSKIWRQICCVDYLLFVILPQLYQRVLFLSQEHSIQHHQLRSLNVPLQDKICFNVHHQRKIITEIAFKCRGRYLYQSYVMILHFHSFKKHF